MSRSNRANRTLEHGLAVPAGEASPLEVIWRLRASALPPVLFAQAAVFAWAVASGKIPAVVLFLFRALLTL